MPGTTWVTNSRVTPQVEGNSMINSYLNSINSSYNDSDLRSFTVNADSLRAYLASSAAIKSVKVIIAHTQDYMNAGYTGQFAGYQAGALTIIMVGFDDVGNYVYYNGKVLDHAMPCPYTCPPGAAGGELLY